MMNNTDVRIWVKFPEKRKNINFQVIVPGVFTHLDVKLFEEDFLIWGCEFNNIIKQFVEFSDFAHLEDWGVHTLTDTNFPVNLFPDVITATFKINWEVKSHKKNNAAVKRLLIKDKPTHSSIKVIELPINWIADDTLVSTDFTVKDEWDFDDNDTQRLNIEFWIDTDGRIHRPTIKIINDWASTHAGIANTLRPDDPHAGDTLFKLGWIIFGSAVQGTTINGAPTQAQINTLDKLGWNRIFDSHGKTHKW